MMNNIDIRLKATDMNVLRSLVGNKLVSMEHDEFVFTNTASQIVRINMENESAYLYSFTEPLDYYGSPEDVAVWTVEQTAYPPVEKKELISIPIQQTVEKIIVIQENQQLYENGIQIYDVWLTRGIIIDLGDHQISFEKSIWFSEDIIVRRGYDLEKQFRSTSEIADDGKWASNIEMKCCRQTEILS